MMPLARRRGSVRFWLLLLLIPGTVALMLIDGWNDYQALRRIAMQAYDEALLEPAKVLETSLEFHPDGSLRLDPPFYAQVMLESRAGSRKYFQVEELSPLALNLPGANAQLLEGRTLLGMQGLPRPPRLSQAEGMPEFYDASYRNDKVRMVALWRDLHYSGVHRQVLILVGESVGMRERTQQEAWRSGLARDGRMLVLVVVLVWISVLWALRPLNALHREVKSRKVDNLMPLNDEQVPREVGPLVKAVNHHIDLYKGMLDKQAQFLADASHQLRTPLAIMRTQAQYARREPDIHRVRESLGAIIHQLEQTSRLTEQLLSLAHASREDTLPQTRVELNQLARDIALQYLPLARERRQDLGWADWGCQASRARRQAEGQVVSANEGIWVVGSEVELREALSNLVHNAINHAGDGCTITVAAGQDERHAWVAVCDNGIGLDPGLRDSVFVRFDRGRKQVGQSITGSGSGLGLAIALAYAERNRGTIVLRDGDPSARGGVGLCALLQLPRAAIRPSSGA